MSTQPKKKVHMVCTQCGSESVLADAYAEWNFATQSWEVQNVFDKGHFCNNCDGECRIEEQEVPCAGEDQAPAAEHKGNGNSWPEDPDWPISEWREDVRLGDTRLGYVEWAAYQRESAKEDQAEAEADGNG